MICRTKVLIFMKELLFLGLFFLLAGCAQSGYTPSYIISDVEKESYTIDE